MADVISLAISLISVSIAVVALVFARLDPRPKIRGQINSVLHVPLELPNGAIITAMMTYITLTNSRKNPAHIVSYDLTIDRGIGPQILTRLKEVHEFPTFHYGNLQIELDADTLIYRHQDPVVYGDARFGLVIFYIEEADVGEDDVISYTMTVSDVFGNRYTLADDSRRDTPGGFGKVELFQLAGARVTRKP